MKVEVPANSNYVITGPDCQILTVNLKPGEKLQCEPGSMMFMSPSVKSVAECGTIGRCCAGEALCKSVYTNNGTKDAYLAVSPNFPAKVIPIHLPDYHNKIIAKRGAFMSSVGNATVDFNCDCNCITGTFGGLGKNNLFMKFVLI